MLQNLVKQNLSQISAVQSAYQLVKDPNQLEEVLNLSNRLTELARPADIERLATEICKDQTAVRAIDKRYRVKLTGFEKFKKFSKGTLGRAFYAHLERSGITPESLTPPPVHDDLSYVTAHLYETHDIWHTITGFDTSVAGELGLAAFGAAQFPSQFNYILLSGGLLNTAIFAFDDRHARMNAITRGWLMGAKSKRLFGAPWNQLWKKPLSEIREQYGIDA